MSRHYYKGKYLPKNPQKYAGDPANIVYRSSWEKKAMIFFDNHPSIIRWASEEIPIPYWFELDQKHHMYYPDFVVVMINGDNKPETVMIEVKPKKETMVPKATKRNMNNGRYLVEAETYAKNQAKWASARLFCEKRNWKFIVMTEDHLFPKGKGT